MHVRFYSLTSNGYSHINHLLVFYKAHYLCKKHLLNPHTSTIKNSTLATTEDDS